MSEERVTVHIKLDYDREHRQSIDVMTTELHSSLAEAVHGAAVHPEVELLRAVTYHMDVFGGTYAPGLQALLDQVKHYFTHHVSD